MSEQQPGVGGSWNCDFVAVGVASEGIHDLFMTFITYFPVCPETSVELTPESHVTFGPKTYWLENIWLRTW